MGEYTKETEYDDEPVGKVCTVEGIEIQSYIGTNIIEIQCTDNDYIHQVPLEEVFPIVRRLEDLNKVCNEDNETYLDVLRQHVGIWLYYSEVNGFYKYYGGRIIEKYRFPDTLPFISVKKLVEWHFDIANLIEKHEAIDINTLSENPYE